MTFPFMQEDVATKGELRFESGNPKRRLIKFDFLFVECMRSVVAAENIKSAIRQALEKRLNVAFGAQRRVHLVIAVKSLKALIGKGNDGGDRLRRKPLLPCAFASRSRRTLPPELMCWQ